MEYQSIPSHSDEYISQLNQKIIFLEKEIQDIKSKLSPPIEKCTDNNTPTFNNPEPDCTECCLLCSLCCLTQSAIHR